MVRHLTFWSKLVRSRIKSGMTKSSFLKPILGKSGSVLFYQICSICKRIYFLDMLRRNLYNKITWSLLEDQSMERIVSFSKARRNISKIIREIRKNPESVFKITIRDKIIPLPQKTRRGRRVMGAREHKKGALGSITLRSPIISSHHPTFQTPLSKDR
ncbi:MAG: hypothetical protein A2156_11335 [Deltaproteobacteria bacterium RBG_16_48_10]|nr:MAG: hypothetical protein A2156_11335 [Deltaproteobacteria bacterium RBG_16_48_10]